LLIISPPYTLILPIHDLIYHSVGTGVFSDIWKQSFVTPIYKSGDKSNVRNYRPITKLSAIPKLFEAIITKKLISLLVNYISPAQHGFLPASIPFQRIF